MAEDRAGWSPFLLLICIELTVGAVLPVGYCFGVVNAPADFIKVWATESANSHYSTKLNDGEVTLVWASIVSIFQIGGICGSLCAASINSRMGRRGTLQLSGLIFMISGILHFFCRQANSLELLLLGRLVGGVASALVYATQPMYLVELAPLELSGSVGVFTCIGITGGVVVGQIFSFDFFWGDKSHWHWALSAFMLFVVIGLLPLCLFPESPRYLISKGNQEMTKAALMKLRRSQALADKELAEMEATSKSTKETMTMKEVICDAKLKMPLIIVCSFHFVQQGSGINAIWYYSVGIFTGAGFTTPMALWFNFALGVLNFAAALCGPFLMTHFNRRILMLLSCSLSAVFMVLLSLGLYFSDSVQWMSYICIIFLSMYILTFNLGLGALPHFIGPELLITSPLPAVMAFGSLFNWSTNFIIGMIFPIMNNYIGPFAFLPFAVICIYGFFLTYWYLPETRNRTPEEVAPLLENGFKSKIK
ncbi:hypothetical protein ACLKA7_014446 [Drosophila subpalustris]